MSGCTMPILAANIAVVAPMIPTTASAVGAYSNSGDRRATMNTPAVTIVAAWIRALTGVGPSIASGSQVWRGICADLATAPTSNKNAASSSAGPSGADGGWRHRMLDGQSLPLPMTSCNTHEYLTEW